MALPVSSFHCIELTAAFKTRNFGIPTPDGETLGAWHVL